MITRMTDVVITPQQRSYNDAAWQRLGNTGASPAVFIQDGDGAAPGARVDGALLDNALQAINTKADVGQASLRLLVTGSGGPTDVSAFGPTNPLNLTQTWDSDAPTVFNTRDTGDSNIRLQNNVSDADLVRDGLIALLFIPQINGADINEHSVVLSWGSETDFDNPTSLPFSDDQHANIRVISEAAQNRLTYRVVKGTDSMPSGWGYQVYLVYASGVPGAQGPSGANAEPHQLDPSVTLPPPDTIDEGALRSYKPSGGEFGLYLNQPRPGAEASNTAQGVAAQASSAGLPSGAVVYQFREDEPHGDTTIFFWFSAGQGDSGLLSRLFIGKRHADADGGPPASLYVRVAQGSTTITAGQMSRNAAADQTNEYAYDQSATRINLTAGTTRIEVYTDSGYATAYALRDEREWEPVGVTVESVADAMVRGAATADADIAVQYVAGEIVQQLRAGVVTPGDLAPHGASQAGETWLSRMGIAVGRGLALSTDAATGLTTFLFNPSSKLEQVLASFTGDGYSAGGGVTAPQATAPTAANIDAFTFAETQTAGARLATEWIGIRIPLAAKDDLVDWRLVAGEDISDDYRDVYPASGWTHLADDTAYAYYTQRLTSDVPAGDEFGLQERVPFHLDPALVDARGQLVVDDLSVNTTFTATGWTIAGNLLRARFGIWQRHDWHEIDVEDIFDQAAAAAGDAPGASNAVGVEYDSASGSHWIRFGRTAAGELLLAASSGSITVRAR